MRCFFSFSIWAARRARWGRCYAAALLALAGVGCGASFEVLHEGDVRFAHCDRLDLDQHITASHRLHCWQEWQRVYTFGQTRDRLDYAKRRIAELLSGQTEPAFELPSRPPPRAESSALGLGSAGLGATQQALVTNSECAERCAHAGGECLSGCATKPTGCEPCRSAQGACLEACP
jgi:hypothetical protein